MTDLPAVRPPERDDGTLLARLGQTAKVIITAVDQLKRLEHDDEQIRGQITELSRLVHELAKSNAELTGMMKSIEKRLDDKDRLVEAIVTVRVREELERARRPRGPKA